MDQPRRPGPTTCSSTPGSASSRTSASEACRRRSNRVCVRWAITTCVAPRVRARPATAAATLYASTERTLLVDVLPRAEIARSNASQHWYELANGSRIWLFGLDPDPITRIPSKVGSVELGWAFVDEAAECSLADWVMVKGRLSWPGIGYHQITAATNPRGPRPLAEASVRAALAESGLPPSEHVRQPGACGGLDRRGRGEPR